MSTSWIVAVLVSVSTIQCEHETRVANAQREGEMSTPGGIPPIERTYGALYPEEVYASEEFVDDQMVASEAERENLRRMIAVFGF